jgi:ribonuclease HI
MGIGFTIDVHPEHDGATGYRISYGYQLEPGTNNQAEYLALVHAMRECLKHGITHATFLLDSLIVVQQVGRQWECKETTLKRLCDDARGMAQMFTEFSIKHIDREENEDADLLSRTPTEPTLPPTDIEIQIGKVRRLKISRQQAAMIRWWWVTHRCRNEYRLSRIFGITPSYAGNIGKQAKLADIWESDLPGPHHKGKLLEGKP